MLLHQCLQMSMPKRTILCSVPSINEWSTVVAHCTVLWRRALQINILLTYLADPLTNARTSAGRTQWWSTSQSAVWTTRAVCHILTETSKHSLIHCGLLFITDAVHMILTLQVNSGIRTLHHRPCFRSVHKNRNDTLREQASLSSSSSSSASYVANVIFYNLKKDEPIFTHCPKTLLASNHVHQFPFHLMFNYFILQLITHSSGNDACEFTLEWHGKINRLHTYPIRPWMKTVKNDLRRHKLTWTEAVDLAQNRPLWRLLATSSATRS